MTEQEAESHVAKIKANVADTEQLLRELYEWGGWKVLKDGTGKVYDSWAACIRDRFGMSWQNGYKKLAAGKVRRNLKDSQVANSEDIPGIQLLALRDVPEEKQATVYKVVTADGKKVTAADLRKAATKAMQEEIESLEAADNESLIESILDALPPSKRLEVIQEHEERAEQKAKKADELAKKQELLNKLSLQEQAENILLKIRDDAKRALALHGRVRKRVVEVQVGVRLALNASRSFIKHVSAIAGLDPDELPRRFSNDADEDE